MIRRARFKQWSCSWFRYGSGKYSGK